MTRSSRWVLAACACVLACLGLAGVGRAAAAEDAEATARRILSATGVRGGLVVHVGCGTGKLTAALGANPRCVVHGLDRDAGNVAKAREHVRSLGLYGRVSIDRWDGHALPYVRELVNLLVASDPGGLGAAEIERVLAPRGVAYVRQGGSWHKTVKPVPAASDEWSHFLHDAAGNAVANDERIGPPKRLRWVAGPRWCRSHEFPSSVNAVVVAGGRIFTIFDEGPTGVFRKLPQRCRLIARDAACGALLWKVPMRRWQPEFGTGKGNRWQIHHTIPRRLVAAADRVYVTLGFLDSPVSVLDAATGEILTEALEGTKGTDEMILSDSRLIVKITKGLSVVATQPATKASLKDTLAAIDVATGKPLWRKENVHVVPYALSAQAGRVVYHNLDDLVCLDAATGKELWRAPNPTGRTLAAVSTLVIHDGVVLFHGNGQAPAPAAGKQVKAAPPRTGRRRRRPRGRFYLTAFSLADGKRLWRQPGRRGWAAACTQPTDLFVAGGLVWCGSFQGRDLRTGQIKKQVDVGKLISRGHHYRCHRSKATVRYLILPKRGAEFVDVVGDNHVRHDWFRGPCFTGLTPANGLVYAPPDQCFCYPGVKVPGYLAMSAEPADELKPAGDANLRRGSAYGKVAGGAKASPEDWPVYRHDRRRSGSTTTGVRTDPAPRWEVKLACRGSQPVVVGERLWIAEKDAHRIRCLSAADGKDLWHFTAGGRIDSAPTVHAGCVLFGCRDGSVYCLRATDGALVWRFRAAPDRRTVSFEQVESLWPVEGSVLVQNGSVYFAAGRSSFLDGGILVYALDAATGKVQHSHLLEGPRSNAKTDVGRPFAMEGALPALMVSDGKDLYMQRIKFDPRLSRLPVRRESDLGELDMGARHLVATGDFLDDTGFDRLYWMYSRRWPGFYFAQQSPKAGQLVVFDDTTTYAVKYFYRRHLWSPLLIPAGQGYLLFADDNDNEPTLDEKGRKSVAIEWLPKETRTDKHRRGGRGVEKGTGYIRQRPAKWQKMVPLRIRAMVLARSAGAEKPAGLLFAAGVPDAVPEGDPLAALEGRLGGRLCVFSADDGKKLAEHKLKRPAAFDGMIAARGRLYVATQDGHLLCME